MPAPILQPGPDAIKEAVAILKAGGLVAMPTETVYGLAADATNPEAVAAIYRVKERPVFNPLIAHLSSAELAFAQGLFSDEAKRIADAFWPGPLTMVVDETDTTTVCDLARAGLSTLAVRVPAHPVASTLLEAFGGPLVAPSANPSGRISPTRAEHVAADMAGKIDLILDGGPCTVGIESTVIDARGETPVLLRRGTVTPEEIERIWPGLAESGDEGRPVSPGQLLRHYAPDAALRLDAAQAEPDEAMLGFGDMAADLNLSPSGRLSEAAANLFAMLRELDRSHDRIAVAPIPMDGLGAAINDRLVRAANRG